MNDDIRQLSVIDFLPLEYREAKVKRSAGVWRVLVAAAFGSLLLSAAWLQQRYLRQVEADLLRIQPLYAAAQKLSAELATEQAKLPAIESEAELFTYLRHPWPRTQFLQAILNSVPKSIRLSTLALSFEVPEQPRGEAAAVPKEDPVDKTPSPARDLKRLRTELDGGHWLITIQGTATDLADLHIYLAELEHQKLFAKVDLISIETHSASEAAGARFSAQMVVKPGHGQPGGPKPTSTDVPVEQTAGVLR